MVKPEILIVDDEMSVRSVLVQVLERYGYAVTEAADGEQALERLKEKQFALVITDIKMPVMSGLEVLKKTRQSYPDTQVIIITSHASLDTAVEALRFGAYDYLFKPFEDLALISAAASRAICERLGAELIQGVGNIILVLRRSPKPDPRLSNLIRPL